MLKFSIAEILDLLYKIQHLHKKNLKNKNKNKPLRLGNTEIIRLKFFRKQKLRNKQNDFIPTLIYAHARSHRRT